MLMMFCRIIGKGLKCWKYAGWVGAAFAQATTGLDPATAAGLAHMLNLRCTGVGMLFKCAYEPLKVWLEVKAITHR